MQAFRGRHLAFLCASILCLSAAQAWAEEADRPAEFVAEQKAQRLYRYFLDGMMASPEFHAPNLTFRISNDLFPGREPAPEFYLVAFLNAKRVEIRYPTQGSIYSATRKYFLENPDVSVDRLAYWPPFVHKRIPYEKCPELQAPIDAVEQYMRTTPVGSAPSRNNGLQFLVGYARNNVELTYRADHEAARPVPELLAIRDIALRCARNLPTVAEEQQAERLRDEQEQAEFIRNFKGPLLYSAPPIVMKHGVKTYQSVVGTSCWSIGKDGMCDDVFGIVTSREPIIIRRRDRVSFEIPLPDWLESLDFGLTRVTSKHIRKKPGDEQFTDIFIWEKQVRERPMSEKQRQSIVIDRPPGDYLLTLYGTWNEYGDASHGFYVRVIP